MDTGGLEFKCVPHHHDDVLEQDSLNVPSVCQSCNIDKLVCSCPARNRVDPNDPDKIWAILHYPDSLKISHKMLCSLLKELKEYEDDKVCFNTFEWTLAARVNCADDDPSQGVQISSNTPPPCTDCKDMTHSTFGGKSIDSGDTPATVNGYFCVTAPVDLNKCDSKNPHYVCDYTSTIIVDLRYDFRPKICVGKECGIFSICYLDKIAEKVQEIVASNLKIKGNNTFRVYVLKPQNQTDSGVSPRSSGRTTPTFTDEWLAASSTIKRKKSNDYN